MKKAIFSVLIGISLLSVFSLSAHAEGQLQDKHGKSSSPINASPKTAGNYAVKRATTPKTSAKESGDDGAACSSNEECNSGVCEGGSCCTASGNPCDSTSHCCGHPSQGCTNNTCPE